MTFKTTAETKYQPIKTEGPTQPSSSESLRENKIMSSSGFEKFE